MDSIRSHWGAATIAFATLPLLVSACTGGTPTAEASQHPGRRDTSTTLAVTVTPGSGAVNLPVTTEISAKISNGTVAGVTVTDAAGHPVAGAMRADGSSWVPAEPLDYQTGYRAVVRAKGKQGQAKSQTVSFTTMANPGSNRIGTGLYIADGQTYGVGMPVVVEFDTAIPDSAKAAVERRLFVTSDPPQVGVWRWYGDRQVLYRPESYWRAGTKLTVRTALGGLPVGNTFIDTDRGGTATISNKIVFQVDNATKKMQVYQNDVLTKTFPVSLGSPSTPSSSGNLVIMSHDYQTLFDVPGEYRTTVFYAERITWDGQYIHAAPWSEGDQGSTNVSHGCVNLSMDNAAWVYNNSHIGDPVTVSGTEVRDTAGDGWTVWDLSWADYVKGSALPHPELGQPRPHVGVQPQTSPKPQAAPKPQNSPKPQATPKPRSSHK